MLRKFRDAKALRSFKTAAVAAAFVVLFLVSLSGPWWEQWLFSPGSDYDLDFHL